jgi:hypothetical protein
MSTSWSMSCLIPESASGRRFAHYFRSPIRWRKCRQASSPLRNPPLNSAGGHSLLYESKDWPSAQLEGTLASANLKMLGSTHLEPNLQGRYLGTDCCKRNLHQGSELRVVYTAMEPTPAVTSLSVKHAFTSQIMIISISCMFIITCNISWN